MPKRRPQEPAPGAAAMAGTGSMTGGRPRPNGSAVEQAKTPESPVLVLLSYWGPVIGWMLLISLLSGEPFSAANTNRYIDPILRYFFPHLTAAGFNLGHTLIRKTAHFTEFFVLASLTYWAARRGRMPPWRAQWMLQAMVLAVLYGLVDEAHQAWVPSRTSSMADSGIDALGAAASQAVIYLRALRLRRFGLLR